MKILIIIGSAPCVHDDLCPFIYPSSGNVAGILNPEIDLMAIGLDAVGIYSWPIKYVATNHQEDIPAIRERRRAIGGNLDYQLISFQHGPGVDIVQPYEGPSGSSSLLGALAGISLGYKKIILCGCPLTGNAPEGNPYEAFRPGWTEKQADLEGLVKSMSGFTRALLGEPTGEWLSDRDG